MEGFNFHRPPQNLCMFTLKQSGSVFEGMKKYNIFNLLMSFPCDMSMIFFSQTRAKLKWHAVRPPSLPPRHAAPKLCWSLSNSDTLSGDSDTSSYARSVSLRSGSASEIPRTRSSLPKRITELSPCPYPMVYTMFRAGVRLMGVPPIVWVCPFRRINGESVGLVFSAH